MFAVLLRSGCVVRTAIVLCCLHISDDPFFSCCFLVVFLCVIVFVGGVLDRLDSDVLAMDSDGHCTVVACRDGSLRLLASRSDGGFVQASACCGSFFR